MAAQRRWTLEAARTLFPEVRARTERAVEEVDELLGTARIDDGKPASPEAEEQVRAVVSRWAREMEALGLEVKGVWLVDFDSGAGCYCWRWPEEELAFFHGYEDGYNGRVRIQ